MKSSRTVFIFIIYLLVGVTLCTLGFMGLADEFWSGMGTALIFVAVLRIVRFCRYRRDESYREAVDIAVSDERNRFIRSQAWAWAGYLFIIISGIACIVLRVVGQELFSHAASSACCLLLILYWLAYMLLKRKY